MSSTPPPGFSRRPRSTGSSSAKRRTPLPATRSATRRCRRSRRRARLPSFPPGWQPGRWSRRASAPSRARHWSGAGESSESSRASGNGSPTSARPTWSPLSARPESIEAVARCRPTRLVFEDVHWADRSLLDLIELLGARLRDLPILLLALARPDLLDTRPSWGGGLPAYTALPLDQLKESEARELAAHLLGASENGERAKRAVLLAETGE